MTDTLQQSVAQDTDFSTGFREFAKIPRLYREVVVTEKIDGTNGCVVVTKDGCVSAQSRSQIITPQNDNFGFAKWVFEHEAELATLGPGYHYGEWWGAGIQRRYGLTQNQSDWWYGCSGRDRPSGGPDVLHTGCYGRLEID